MSWWEIIVGTTIASVIAYLIGSFSFSIAIVKLKTKKDVRDEGSKNAGATNASRIIGKKWGATIMILDAFKILLASFIVLGLSQIPIPIFQGILLLLPGLFALIGHCWPIYYKFKGGKAVSCFIGLMFTINYLMGIVMFVTWLILVLTTRKVSISSIIAALITAILMWVPQISGLNTFDMNGMDFKIIYETGTYSAVWFNKFHSYNGGYVYDSFLIINLITTISMIILLARHWQNIQRLIKGVEPTFLKERKSKVEKNSKAKKSKKEDNKEKSTTTK